MYFEVAKMLNPKTVRLREPVRWTGVPDKRIDASQGYDVWDMSEDEVVKEAMEQGLKDLAKALTERDRLEGEKPFLKQVSIDLRKPENEAYLKLTKHPKILATVADYLGMLPVRQSVSLWYSPNEFVVGRSQFYHLDSEDERQVKIFLFLEEVTMDAGPLYVISSRQSRRIWEKLTKAGIVKEKNNKVEDAHVLDAESTDPGQPIIGKAGTMALVDTCNCYHYGSRPSPEGSRPRKVLYMQYTTPFAKNLRLIRKAGNDDDLDNMLALDDSDKLRRHA